MSEPVKAWYYARNFGDAINAPLIELISGRPVKNMRDAQEPSDGEPCYSVVGSVIQFLDRPCTVWGSGIIGVDYPIPIRKHKFVAVRGPLTKHRLIRMGMPCPNVYGDPVLLLPRYYSPEREITHELGIVPHYVNADNQFLPSPDVPGIKIINVYAPPMVVVRQILECKYILSSSLHGLVVADAYRIPSLWIKFDDKILGKDFKFMDYYYSIGYRHARPYRIESPIKWMRLRDKCSTKRLDIDLNALLAACPFKK